TRALVSASWLYTTTFIAGCYRVGGPAGLRQYPSLTTRGNNPAPDKGVEPRSPTGCRNNGRVTSASDTAVVPRTPASRPNLVSVGTIVWLSSELMFFAALFAMYFTIKSVDTGLGQPWPQAELDYPLATVNTIVLILSSVTCQMGVFAVESGQIGRIGPILDARRR